MVLRRGSGEFPSLVARMLDLDGLAALCRRSRQRGRSATPPPRWPRWTNAAEYSAARDQLRELAQRIKTGEGELGEIEADAAQLLMVIPNAPHASVPQGHGEADNPVVSVWGDKPAMSFAPRPHWEVGEALGILDFAGAAKISGARFRPVAWARGRGCLAR